MNIFYLDHDPTLAAQAHVDRHVNKMILESAQMLCSAAHACGVNAASIPYQVAHKNHPCTLWVPRSRGNVLWLAELCYSLNIEKIERFGTGVHASIAVVLNVVPALLASVPEGPVTVPAQAMPDEFRNADAVTAYRSYYANAKAHLHTWTRRQPPSWLSAYVR